MVRPSALGAVGPSIKARHRFLGTNRVRGVYHCLTNTIHCRDESSSCQHSLTKSRNDLEAYRMSNQAGDITGHNLAAYLDRSEPIYTFPT